MPLTTNSVRRLALLCLAFVLLPGFVQIRDEVTVRGSGGAVAKRTVTISGADDLDRVLDLMPERTRGEKQLRKLQSDELRAKICEGLTKDPRYWQLCHWDGNALVVERSWSKRESPFSSSENGMATFALHHWLSNPITRPPFPLVGIGPVMQDDAEHRAFIRDLKEKGFVLEVKVNMPGEIRMLWGKNEKNGRRSVTIDLLEPWPEELTETFIMSKEGLLYSPVFHYVVIFILMIVAFIWMRLAKRGAL
jgi:hypothetical protein